MLAGTKIIEFEGLGPAPFAGMLLADLGADVIIIHRKGGPPFAGLPERPIYDRGKRSIVLDMKDREDLAIARALVDGADALIEGFRPGVMEKLGIGPQACLEANPALVYGRLTGWGQTGPLAAIAGHDLNFTAMSGAAWYASEPGDAPMPPPTLVGDIGGGALYMVVGILAAMLNARKTGLGTVVDASIYDGSAHMMNLLMSLMQSGAMAHERGASVLDGPHWNRTYRTADGLYLSVQCLEPKFYAEFLERLELSDDPHFCRQYDREAWPNLTMRLREIFASKPRADWVAIFAGSDACVAPVLSVEEAASHPVNIARQTWVMANGALQAAPAPRFSKSARWQPPEIPRRDQHRTEILSDLALGS